jgi:hypothetical protein
MKRKCFLTLLFLLAAAAAFSQSAKEMDTLLADEGVSCARAARYVLPAAGVLPEDTQEADAFHAAQEKGWIAPEATPDAPIRLDQFAFLIMQAFAMKGGVCYSVFPGPRYAYRELIYKHYLQGRSDPAQKLSGQRLVLILGRVLDTQEAAL